MSQSNNLNEQNEQINNRNEQNTTELNNRNEQIKQPKWTN